MSEEAVGHQPSAQGSKPMAESSERAAVIREALSWQGTPFHHMGRLKGSGGGADCAYATAMIYHAALPTRVAAPDFGFYAVQWNLSRGVEERYLETVAGLGGVREIAAAQATPGDLALFRIAHAWAHGAIVMPPGWPAIAHADAEAGMFILARGDGGRLARRPKRFFSFW